MKKIIALILSIAIMTTFCACNSSKTTVCNNCGIEQREKANFCSECGTELTFQNSTSETLVKTDYSNFGFQNNYNMNYWIDIRDYNFDDSDDAYIETWAPMVVIFENNYIYTRLSSTTDEEELSYDGLISGELWGEPEKYEVVSNNLIKYSSYGSLEITYVQMEKGIPIIHTDNSHFEMAIPMDFIDFKRGVEVDDNTGIARYYIKSEYIK